MAEHTTIRIIGGSGWLGGAIARALVAAGFAAPDRLRLSYRSSAPTFLPDAFWTRDNQELVDRSDIVVVSVRPADWPSVMVSAKDKLAVSVMAGVRMEHLIERLGTDRAVRALPNAAAEVGQSYTPWVASAATTAGDRQAVTSMFEAIGICDEVGSEAEIDYLTGLSGSGPTFPALLAETMMCVPIDREPAAEQGSGCRPSLSGKCRRNQHLAVTERLRHRRLARSAGDRSRLTQRAPIACSGTALTKPKLTFSSQ